MKINNLESNNIYKLRKKIERELSVSFRLINIFAPLSERLICYRDIGKTVRWVYRRCRHEWVKQIIKFPHHLNVTQIKLHIMPIDSL